MMVAVFSFLLVLGVRAGLLGLPVVFIVSSWFFKYAFILLDHVANGRPGAPVLAMEDANPVGEMRPLAYGCTALVFYSVTGVLGRHLDAGLVSGIRLVGLAALPAVLATHTVTGSFAHSLNPILVADVARRLGAGYLVTLCVAAACWWLGRAVVLDGAPLGLLLRIALLMLLWLEMFTVLGAVIHGRRIEIGFDPEHSPERRRQREDSALDRSRDRFIDQVFAEYRSGSSRNAMESIRRHASASAAPVMEYEWIYARVATWPNPRLGNAVAQELLPLLLAARRNGVALAVASDRLQADPAFRPATGEQTVQLAELARTGGDRALARKLLAQFDERFPGDVAAPRARRLAGQLDGP